MKRPMLERAVVIGSVDRRRNEQPPQDQQRVGPFECTQSHPQFSFPEPTLEARLWVASLTTTGPEFAHALGWTRLPTIPCHTQNQTARTPSRARIFFPSDRLRAQ